MSRFDPTDNIERQLAMVVEECVDALRATLKQNDTDPQVAGLACLLLAAQIGASGTTTEAGFIQAARNSWKAATPEGN